mgnify:FL=1|jgi:hypothetical protein|tara:strand:- start:1661 stop:1870 length:210 start_codon:yes stop_codon:yes gene_type:complete
MLDDHDRDIIYKLIEQAKPTPIKLMGEDVMNIADMAIYSELNILEQKLKSTDSRYEPVSREEYKNRGGK